MTPKRPLPPKASQIVDFAVRLRGLSDPPAKEVAGLGLAWNKTDGSITLAGKPLDMDHPETWGAIIMAEVAQMALGRDEEEAAPIPRPVRKLTSADLKAKYGPAP